MTKSKPYIPTVYMRGGTSKALFFHAKDLPAPGPERDRLLIRFIGSPDPMQIDGMGGSHLVTSKIAIIAPSEREDVDVDYTFVQIGINEASIDYSGNCGNISAGVGPFAIQEGLIKTFRKGISLNDNSVLTQEVRIFNTGTKKVLVSHVAIDDDGMPLEDDGSFEIAGCPGSAAPILMDYRKVVGAALGKGALPTSQVVDKIDVAGTQIEYTLCDVANIIVFANANDMGIQGDETAAALSDNKSLDARIKELRGKVAQLVGLCQDWEKVDEQAGMLPMVALVSPPTDPVASIQSRIFLDHQCHTSMAGTGAICTTACSRITGSVVNKLMRSQHSRQQTFQIQHPLGLMPVIVDTEPTASIIPAVPAFKTLSFLRTARRLMDGRLYVPVNVRDTLSKESSQAKTRLAENTGKQNTIGSPGDKESSVSSAHSSTHSATESFSNFIYNLKFTDLDDKVIIKLKSLLLDHIGVAAAAVQEAESSEPFIKAIKSLDDCRDGSAAVIATDLKLSPPFAALLNAALSHSLDFDDTHADGFLHPGTTVIATVLAEAGSGADHTTEDVLTALAAGYEVKCRLGMALGAGGPQRGFHNTAIAGIFGAVSALTKLRRSSLSVIQNAFGLALSKAAGSQQYLANGSWNKRLHPGFAAHDAFVVVTLAEAGVIGSANPFDGQYGLLNLYSSKPRSDILSIPFDMSNLFFMNTSIKPYPACRLTHPQIEAIPKMREDFPERESTIESVLVKMSPEAFNIVGVPHANKRHPTNIVDAQFSSYYQLAVALLYGSGSGWKAYDHLKDEAVSHLLDRINIEADASFGRIETSITITWTNGSQNEYSSKTIRGEPGNPFTWEDIISKFKTVADPVFGGARVGSIIDVVQNLEQHKVTDLVSLIA